MLSMKAARVNKRMTQEEAAKLIGVAKNTISNWEVGKTIPSVYYLANIEDAYGISFRDLEISRLKGKR